MKRHIFQIYYTLRIIILQYLWVRKSILFLEFEPVILTPFKAYFNGVYYMEKKNYIKVFGVVAIILAVFALFLYAICYVCVEYRDNRSSLSSDIGQESVTPTADIERGPAAYDVEYELGETTAAAMRSKWNTYVNSSSEDNVVRSEEHTSELQSQR